MTARILYGPGHPIREAVRKEAAHREALEENEYRELRRAAMARHPSAFRR